MTKNLGQLPGYSHFENVDTMSTFCVPLKSLGFNSSNELSYVEGRWNQNYACTSPAICIWVVKWISCTWATNYVHFISRTFLCQFGLFFVLRSNGEGKRGVGFSEFNDGIEERDNSSTFYQSLVSFEEFVRTCWVCKPGSPHIQPRCK